MEDETTEDSTKPFRSLSQYAFPSMPTDESIRRVGWDLWRRWRGKQIDDPFIADDSLNVADRNLLDQLAAPPAYGPLLAELRVTFEDWFNDPDPANCVQLVALPPCDQGNLLQSWADTDGHTVVESPARESLLVRETDPIRLPQTQSLLVVPKLERWFLRHHNGLGSVQQLLDQLATAKRHCVIGCNTWAWSYLSKAIQTDLVLPSPMTFKPFDGARLKRWIEQLASANDSSTVFRFSESGNTVFGDDAKLNKTDDFFATTAARSLGSPLGCVEPVAAEPASRSGDGNGNETKIPR